MSYLLVGDGITHSSVPENVKYLLVSFGQQ